MPDRRAEIIQAAMAVLRERGYPGLTQLRVPGRAGIRQSHLTYYFPTRLDLVTAVAEVAVDGQLATFDALAGIESVETAAAGIAVVIARPEAIRVLLALIIGADTEPGLRPAFARLAGGMIERGHILLAGVGLADDDISVRMLHALAVGLAVLGLGRGGVDDPAQFSAVLRTAMEHLTPRRPDELPFWPSAPH